MLHSWNFWTNLIPGQCRSQFDLPLRHVLWTNTRRKWKFVVNVLKFLLSVPSWSLDGVTRSEPQTISKFLRSDHPRVFIQDLQQDSSGSSSNSVLISCQIYKIYFLVLEFICASHGVVRTDDSGRCVKCEGSTEFRASARWACCFQK